MTMGEVRATLEQHGKVTILRWSREPWRDPETNELIPHLLLANVQRGNRTIATSGGGQSRQAAMADLIENVERLARLYPVGR